MHANRSFVFNKTQINGSQVNISTSNKSHATGSQHHKIQVNRTQLNRKQVELSNSNESNTSLLNQTTVKPNPVAAVIIGNNKSVRHLGSLNDDFTTSTTILPPQVNHSTPMKIFDNNHSIQSSTEGSISENSTSTTTISSVSTTSTTTQTVIHTENHISFVNNLNRTPTQSAYNPEYLYALDLASQLNGFDKNITNS